MLNWKTYLDYATLQTLASQNLKITLNTIKTDIVIIGGGIVGISTAYYLVKSGINCIVIEKDSLGSHASGFAYGGIGASKLQGLNYPLALKGCDLHNELNEFLTRETGMDIQYRVKSSIKLAFNEEEKKYLTKSISTEPEEDNHNQFNWLEPSQIFSLEPSVSKEIIGGVFQKNALDVDPYRLLLALYEVCERRGSRLVNSEVIDLKITRSTSPLITLKNKDQISCNKIVASMGPWTQNLSNWINVKMPIKPLKGQILRLEMPGIMKNCSLSWSGNYANLKADGLIWTGTTEENQGFNATISDGGRTQIMRSAIRMIPCLERAKVVLQTACLRPMSPDNLPVLGNLDNYPQIYIATGGLRSGITLGPAMGKIISELISNNSTQLDITPFSPNRFD